MCRFPASGSSRKSFARGCVPMDDPGCWQWVTREEIIQSIPVEPTPTIPPRQPFLPDPDDLIGVPAQSFDVARDAVVGIVAPHHHRQMGVLAPDGLMPVGPTPICNRRQRAGVTALGRYLPHHILACPRLAPRVGKAEEGERGTIRLRMVSPIWPVELCGNVRILEAFDQIIAKLSDLYSCLGAVLLGQHGQASFESDAERS